MNKQSCHNCKHAYPNYLHFVGGPCLIFELHFGDDGWYTLDPDTGCEFWKSKKEEKIMSLSECTDRELKEKIEKRGKKEGIEKPNQLAEVDLAKLRTLCSDYIDFVASEDFYRDWRMAVNYFFFG